MKKNFKDSFTPEASVKASANGYRLSIPRGEDDNYRVAQIDDYTHLKRRHFPAQPPQNLSLHARVSAQSLPGTWGFGLWNDPFGFSFGFGGKTLRLPALPNAIWFFHASDENYLSFGDGPGNGFLVQVFRSPSSSIPYFPLMRVGASYLFSRSKARSMMSGIVEEEEIRLDLDVTQWHRYRFEWMEKQSAFWVDDDLVLETSMSPHPPLGMVIWIDNQYAAWHPEGKVQFGVLKNEECWLEVDKIEF